MGVKNTLIMKKLLYLFLAITVACVGSDDDGNPCIYLPVLDTQAATEITETTATLNGIIDSDSNNCNATANNTEQGFVYATTIQPTINDFVVNVNGIVIDASIENLEPNTSYYIRTFLTNAFGDFYGNEVSLTTLVEQCDVVYLANNGITIKAYECANVGDTGVVNGVTYTVVDEAMLRDMIVGGEDVTRVATTRVTAMNDLFLCYEDFNQPIGHWDVTNVIDMSGMFVSECGEHQFNQPIGDWDVSNVTNMNYMFAQSGGVFNQPIGDWNVSNVTNMALMFSGATSFNQDLSSWDVINVIDMGRMFDSANSFNQDLGNWNVDNVENCFQFDYNTPQWTQPKPNFTNCIP